MTAETELLPTPSGNVAHLISAQAAEIEALREDTLDAVVARLCLRAQGGARKDRAHGARAEADGGRRVATRERRRPRHVESAQ